MNKEEMGKLVLALQSYYPHAKLLETKEAVALWYMELKELPYQAVVNAVRKHVNTSDKVITIHSIKSNCVDHTADWGDAWAVVLRKVGKFGMYREKEAYEEMDELTVKAVKSIGWKQLCLSDNADVVRGQFRNAYEQGKARKIETEMLPSSLKESIEKLGSVMQIGE